MSGMFLRSPLVNTLENCLFKISDLKALSLMTLPSTSKSASLGFLDSAVLRGKKSV